MTNPATSDDDDDDDDDDMFVRDHVLAEAREIGLFYLTDECLDEADESPTEIFEQLGDIPVHQMHLYTMDLDDSITTTTTTTTTGSIVGHYLHSDQQLQSLTLEHIHGGGGIHDLFQGLRAHPAIQTLNLAYVHFESADSVSAFGAFLQRTRTLTLLNLSRCRVSAAAAQALAHDGWRHNTSLTRVKMELCELSIDTFAALVKIGICASRVQHLSVVADAGGPLENAASLQHVLDGTKQPNSHLESLHSIGAFFSHGNAEENMEAQTGLVEFLTNESKESTSLRHLDMRQNTIRGCAPIFSSLETNTFLLSLGIYFDGHEAPAFLQLLESLPHMRVLQKLQICVSSDECCKIEKFEELLDHAFEKNTSLCALEMCPGFNCFVTYQHSRLKNKIDYYLTRNRVQALSETDDSVWPSVLHTVGRAPENLGASLIYACLVQKSVGIFPERSPKRRQPNEPSATHD